MNAEGTPSVPLAEQIAEIERELKIKQRVYPRWVADGRLSLKESAERIARTAAALDTLKSVGQPRLL